MKTRILEAVLLSRETPTPNHRWFRLVTPRRDDHGTVILPDGGELSRHKANPLFLWMHRSGPSWRDPSTPGPEVAIGTTEEWEQTEDHLDILVRFDDQSELARTCRDKVAGGFIRCCSVGFDVAPPAEGQPLPEEVVTITQDLADKWPGTKVGEQVPVIRRWVLLEASLVLIGSNQDALTYLRALGEPPRGGAYHPPETRTAPQQEQPMAASPPKVKMSPECRWMYRGMVSRNMEAAEHALRTMEHAPAEHQEHLRAGFQSHLDHAQKSADHLRMAEGGEENGEDMTRSKRSAARTAPGTKAEFAADRARFSEVAGKVAAFEVRALSEVVTALLETDDADIADAKITALQGSMVRYRELKAERQTQADDVEAKARETKITALQDEHWMTPAHAERARKEKWSLSRLAAYEAEAKKEGPPVAITRTRDLRGVDDPAKPAGSGAGSVTPATPSAGGGPSGDKAADTFAAYVEGTGIDPEKVRARIVKNRQNSGIAHS